MKRILLLSWLVIISTLSITGQKLLPKNLPDFDDSPFHFGFLVSGNRSFFDIRQKFETSFNDSLYGIVNDPQPGFNLALLASYNPIPALSFRFIPGLAFQDRALQYRFLKSNKKEETIMVRTESVWLEFPILLKMRTNRVGNFASYALAGAKYGIDMQTQKDVNNALVGDAIIKLQNKDFCLEFGGGADFFMPFFKFSTEFKIGYGQNNLLIPDGTRYTNAIESLRTRTYVFTISFEG